MKKQSKKKSDSPRSGQFETSAPDSTLREWIARKAYELHEKRGWVHGLDVVDWLEAERVVLAETNAETRTETDVKAMTPPPGKNMATRPRSILDQP